MRSSWLALLFAFATSAASAALVVSCSAGGNGIGSAPKQPDPCPAAVPVDKSACKGPQVCGYPSEGCDAGEAGSCDDNSGIVALCPSANATWQVSTRGDAGGFADAPIEETSADGASSDAPVDGDAEPTDAPADSEIDSAVTDSGTTDSGTTDSGATDSGPADSGAVDSGSADSGAPDLGIDVGLDVLGD